MDTLVSDNFDTIGTADIFDRTPVASTIGAKWRRQSGRSFDGDGSGRVKSGNDGSQASIDTGASDLDITVDVTFVGSVSRFSIGARANSTFNPTDQSAYSVWNTDASNIRLSWFSSTDVRTDYAVVSAGLTFVADTVYTLRLLISGTSIKFYINGVERISQTDANVPSRPHVTLGGLGIGANYADTRYDNFVVSSVGGAPADTEKPVLTGSITVGTKTSSTIDISWPAGGDNVAVTGYEVSSNGGTNWAGVGNVLTHTFTGLAPLTSYELRVRAKDAAGNSSTPPLALSETTEAAPAIPKLTLPALRNNTGMLLAGQSNATAHVYGVGSGDKVITVAGLSTDGAGVMEVSHVSLAAGTEYRVVVVLASGAEGLQKVTATV